MKHKFPIVLLPLLIFFSSAATAEPIHVSIETQRIIEQPEATINSTVVVLEEIGRKLYKTDFPEDSRHEIVIELIIPVKKRIFSEPYKISTSLRLFKSESTPKEVKIRFSKDAITNMFNCNNVTRYYSSSLSTSDAFDAYLFWKYVYQNCNSLGRIKGETEVKEVALNNWLEAHKMLRNNNPTRFLHDVDLLRHLDRKYCTNGTTFASGAYINLKNYFLSDLQMARPSHWRKMIGQKSEIKKSYVSKLYGVFDDLYGFEKTEKQISCSIISKYVNNFNQESSFNSTLTNTFLYGQSYNDLKIISDQLLTE